MTHTVQAGWHSISDHHGCRVVWAEPDRPRAGWVACFKSRQDAESMECSRALLLRVDEFGRVMVAPIVDFHRRRA